MTENEWQGVAGVLRDVDFPANKQDIVNHARQQGADDRTQALIGRLPLAVYRNMVDVRTYAATLT